MDILTLQLPPDCELLAKNTLTKLNESLKNFKDLIVQFEKLYLESKEYKNKFMVQKEKCESQKCASADDMRRIIASKDNIIATVGSEIIKLNETRNFKMVTDIFKILCGESTIMTPPKESEENDNTSFKPEHNETDKIKIKEENLFSTLGTPQRDNNISKQNETSKDESVSEIEGTPTGRISPVLVSRKLKSSLNSTSTSCAEKKKCPEEWQTPEKKFMKLRVPTPKRGNGGKTNIRMRQARLDVFAVKASNTVDLTSSPEFSGAERSRSESSLNQTTVKREPLDNDDTIMPSPTSGPSSFPSLLKVSTKNSPQKFKKPLSCKKSSRAENIKPPIFNSEDLIKDQPNTNAMEDSITILNPKQKVKKENDSCKVFNDENTPSRLKEEVEDSVNLLQDLPIGFDLKTQNDTTRCDDSISLLAFADKFEHDQKVEKTSPSKRPLVENVNITNIDKSGSSIEKPETSNQKLEKVKRKTPEKVEPVYKEPTVRKKAEKRALPGWSCDECKHFYAELYADNPEMLLRKMTECSKHRGRVDPTRPATPPSLWQLRWDVPTDTEQFNARNNV